MNLCHCNSLTEAQIREAIADGARTVRTILLQTLYVMRSIEQVYQRKNAA